MRLQYRTLDHLPKETFAQQIRIAEELENEEPGYLRSAAESYNMLQDFDSWQERLNRPGKN